jgi:hypothetical protein
LTIPQSTGHKVLENYFTLPLAAQQSVRGTINEANEAEVDVSKKLLVLSKVLEEQKITSTVGCVFRLLATRGNKLY